MVSQSVLGGALGVVLCGVLVSTAGAAGSEIGLTATDAAAASLPEMAVAPPTDDPDVTLFRGSAEIGQATFSPVDSKRLIVGIGSTAGNSRCLIKASANGGKTWASVQLPQPQPRPGGATRRYCSASAPAVTYSPDGRRLYAAYAYSDYSDVNTGIPLSGVVVSISTNNGTTWSAPKVALPEVSVDSQSVDQYHDTRLTVSPDSKWVYVAAILPGYFGDGIIFGRSSDYGATWAAKMITYGDSIDGTAVGDRAGLAAGRDGVVLISYSYFIYGDAASTYSVHLANSSDHGASFMDIIADQHNVGDDNSGELDRPDVKIAPLGIAHLVYAKGRNSILYKYSAPPYKNWSAMPVRLDGNVAQVALTDPYVAIGACGQASVLSVIWMERRNNAGRVLYTRKVAKNGYAWSRPLKVGASSNQLNGDALAAAGSRAISLWSIFPKSANDWSVFGSPISSGVACP